MNDKDDDDIIEILDEDAESNEQKDSSQAEAPKAEGESVTEVLDDSLDSGKPEWKEEPLLEAYSEPELQEEALASAENESLDDTDEQPPVVESATDDTTSELVLSYAGFWLRVGAFFIDFTVIYIAFRALSLFILEPFFGFSEAKLIVGFSALDTTGSATGFHLAVATVLLAISLLAYLIVGWLYFAALEASNLRATLGKFVFALYVGDKNGEKITFVRASCRHFAKAFSVVIFGLGFVMAGLSEKKRALHDIAAGTLVLKRKPLPLPNTAILAIMSLASFCGAMHFLKIEVPELPAVTEPPVIAPATSLPPLVVPGITPTVAPETQLTPETGPKATPMPSSFLDANGDTLNLNYSTSVWDSGKRELRTSFHEHEESKAANVILQLYFKEGSDIASIGNLNSCTLNLNGMAPKLLSFPCHFPPKKKINLQTRVVDLNGSLKDGESISGEIRGVIISLGKDFTKQTFKWHLFFYNTLTEAKLLPLKDAGGTNVSIGLDDTTVPSDEFDPIPEDAYGYVMAGDNTAVFDDIVALLHTRYNRLEIGFFVEPLTSDHRQQIIRKRTVGAYIDNIRPNLTLNIVFKQDTRTISKRSISEYSIAIFRDIVGGFSFPGPHDRRSFNRLPLEIPEDEIELISGKLEDGGTVGAVIKGREELHSTDYGWSMDFKIKIVAVP